MEKHFGDKLKNISGITCDSRKVKPDNAFIAIKGLNKDGHKYIEEAINNGAKLIITEKNINISKEGIKIFQVNNTRKALGKLAALHYNQPSSKLETIGVTGTNGKTSTVHLIYNLLNWKKTVRTYWNSCS
ncbi:MAG: Mur ligase domain-containing protein [Bacteroidales bacterium]